VATLTLAALIPALSEYAFALTKNNVTIRENQVKLSAISDSVTRAGGVV